MEDSYPGVLSQLKYFVSDDPSYYDSLEFRQVAIPNLFSDVVRRRIARVVRIPPGLQQDDPDLDNLTEDTFSKIRKGLDPKRIAEHPSPESRCKTCLGFVLTVATNHAIDFSEKNGSPWDHDELPEDTPGHEQGLLDDPKPQAATESQEDDSDRVFKDRLREVLSSQVNEIDFEIFWLRRGEELHQREIRERFPQFTTNRIGVKTCRVLKRAKSILRDPAMLRRLLGGDNDQRK